MGDAAQQGQAYINYYARKGLWHHVIDVADQLVRGNDDPVFRFWKAFGMMKEENSLSNAIREFNALRKRREMALPATVAALYAHKQSQLVDAEAVEELQAELAVQESAANNDSALMYTACFYWHVGEDHQAREHVSLVLQRSPSFRDDYLSAQALRGWIDLTCSREIHASKSVAYFDAVLAESTVPGRSHSAVVNNKCLEVSRSHTRPCQQTF